MNSMMIDPDKADQPEPKPTSAEPYSVFKKLVDTPGGIFSFLIMSVILSAVALNLYQREKPFNGQSFSFYFLVVYAGGSFGLAIMGSFRQSLKRVREQGLAEGKRATLEQLQQKDFRNVRDAQKILEEKAEHDFRRNLGSKIALQQLKANGLVLFPQAQWKFQPGVNVLLGRNGYGKSLLLRTLAAIVQHEEEILKGLLRNESGKPIPVVEIDVIRDGQPGSIRRDAKEFLESVGKVPLLAIPDSRFLDRSQDIEEGQSWDLRVSGAHHFVHQKPFTPIIRELLREICLDYLDHGKSFNLPVFRFIGECVKRLTNYSFRFHEIKRKGRTGFEIWVLTDGNEEPLLIQHASQGTLSVLAMCGLIRSYVRSLSPNTEDNVIQKGSGIVLIDEADAHLHPSWQQKFPSLLREFFPNVQFILSAHSPLFVAGCWRNEVAVLRRNQTAEQSTAAGFFVEPVKRDYVGATAQELYRDIFEIEELDDTYLEYATKATGPDKGARITQLVEQKQKDGLSETLEAELRQIEEEARRIRRVREVKQDRHDQLTKDVQIVKLETKVAELERAAEDRKTPEKTV